MKVGFEFQLFCTIQLDCGLQKMKIAFWDHIVGGVEGTKLPFCASHEDRNKLECTHDELKIYKLNKKMMISQNPQKILFLGDARCILNDSNDDNFLICNGLTSNYKNAR